VVLSLCCHKYGERFVLAILLASPVSRLVFLNEKKTAKRSLFHTGKKVSDQYKCNEGPAFT
jgi:hypothetical protein